jgi:hypothetical protein
VGCMGSRASWSGRLGGVGTVISDLTRSQFAEPFTVGFDEMKLEVRQRLVNTVALAPTLTSSGQHASLLEDAKEEADDGLVLNRLKAALSKCLALRGACPQVFESPLGGGVPNRA